MIVSRQTNIFEQQRKENYEAYYKKFYARNLKEAEARREKAKHPDPVECILISTGEVITFGEMINRMPKKR